MRYIPYTPRNEKVSDAIKDYYKDIFIEILDKYADSLHIIKKAVDEDWTISRLISELNEDSLIIILGDTCGGVDAVDLVTGELNSLTW